MNLSQKWAGFREFLSDVKKESGKVTWPGKDEVVGTTTVVVEAVAPKSNKEFTAVAVGASPVAWRYTVR